MYGGGVGRTGGAGMGAGKGSAMANCTTARPIVEDIVIARRIRIEASPISFVLRSVPPCRPAALNPCLALFPRVPWVAPREPRMNLADRLSGGLEQWQPVLSPVAADQHIICS